MKIAVTGASGHIGANLCPYLLERGHDVSVLINKTPIQFDGVRIVKGSILDSDAIQELVQGMDVVVHLAAKISLEKDVSGALWKINVGGTQNVVDACIKHGISKLIHFSSIHRFDPFPQDEVLDETRRPVEHGTDYDRSKVASEELVQQAQEQGIVTTVIYPTSVIGPNDYGPSLLGQGVIDMYQGKVPVLAPGGYNFVDVRDLVRGTYEVIIKDYPDERFLLAGHYLSLQELAKQIGQNSPNRVNTAVLPSVILKALIPLIKLQSKFTGKPSPLTKEALQVLLEGPRNISTAKAEQQLGYTKTPSQQTIRETIEWFKREKMI